MLIYFFIIICLNENMEIVSISHIKPHRSSTESASRIPALSALMQLRFNFSINKKNNTKNMLLKSEV